MTNNKYTDDATVADWSLSGDGWNEMSTDITNSKNVTDKITVSSNVDLDDMSDDIDTKLTKDGTQKITVGTTEPSTPQVGDIWVDTN